MKPDQILGAVTTLRVTDSDGCDRVALSELAGLVRQVRGWLDAVEATIATRAARLSAPEVLTPGRASRDVRVVAARGALCDELPVLHDALASGEVAAGHVDAIARVAAPGRRTGPCRAGRRRRVVGGGGGDARRWMRSNVTSPISPAAWRVTGAPPRSGCGRSARCAAGPTGRPGCATPTSPWTRKPTPWSPPPSTRRSPRNGPSPTAAGRSTSCAPTPSSRWSRHGPGAGRRPAQVNVLIDHATLLHGLHERSVCETSDGQPLTPDAVRRLACDAELIPTVLGSTGAVLDQGRARRVATAAQRHALRAMYRTCGHPDCTVRFADCEIHHVIEWIHQHGPTDLANLLPLCNEHHHLVHDAGWHLTLHPTARSPCAAPTAPWRSTAPASTSPPPASPPHPTSPTSPTADVDRRPRPSRRALHPRRMTTTTSRPPRSTDRPQHRTEPDAFAATRVTALHRRSLVGAGRSTGANPTATDATSQLQEPLQRPGAQPPDRSP